MSENIDQDHLSAAAKAAASDFDDEKVSGPPPDAHGALKRAQEWFTFENRCMVCGMKFPALAATGYGAAHHLGTHCEEGVMKKWGRFYEQIKAHPVGFPGILLPKELQWSR